MLFELFSVFFGVSLSIYAYVRAKHKYWKNAGVPYTEPSLIKGNLKGVGSKFPLFELMTKQYQKFKEKAPFFGFYFFTMPVAVLTDISLVKLVMSNDKENFTNKGIYFNEKEDPLSAHLLIIDNPKWKILRANLSPTFTSGKMKLMFGTIVDVAHKLVDTLDKESKNVKNFEIKDILARFTTDVIGCCAFGLEFNSLEEPENDFITMGKKVVQMPFNSRMMFLQSFRDVGRKLKMKFLPEEVASFFLEVIKDTINFRETNSVERNDFLNILMQMKNKGVLESDEKQQKKIFSKKLTIEEIAAHAFIFFLGGFETSSTALTYVLYELAMNQNIQLKARENVKKVLNKHNCEFTYEAAMKMTYLDQCINESLRKYPPSAEITRVCERDYKIEGTDHTIKAGTKMFIPIYAIHHDPEYYPSPEIFDPERFSSTENQTRNPYTFLSFGEGPRNCIGLRFGVLQVKIGLALLLTNFKFEICEKTKIPIEFASDVFALLTPKGGVHLKITKI